MHDAPLPENAAADNAGHNQPELSVGDLSRAIKGTLEGRFDRVRVRGEVVGAKRHSSGHFYFDLKDADGGTAKIAGVCWKSQVRALSVIPKDGDEVVVTGRVTTYADRSSYQLQALDIVYAGEGALLARIERLKQALLAEGLFDPARKRPIPMLPRVIGVVTSPTGAVIRDILHRLADRFPVHVLVWPVAVQGQGAAEQVSAGILGFNALPADGPIPRPDVLIVARGGGSLEDLMPFSEEIVVRAAAASRIPLISAIGHETDNPLLDLAADLRAPTPTGAAEMAVPVRRDLARQLAALGERASACFHAGQDRRRLGLERAAQRLPDLPRLVAERRQQLDDRAARLGAALPSWVRARRTLLGEAARRLASPAARIERARGALGLHAQGLESCTRRGLERRRDAVAALTARLEAVSYEATLKRGFALVADGKGNPLTSAAAVKPGARLAIAFADGQVAATADAPSRQGKLL